VSHGHKIKEGQFATLIVETPKTKGTIGIVLWLLLSGPKKANEIIIITKFQSTYKHILLERGSSFIHSFS